MCLKILRVYPFTDTAIYIERLPGKNSKYIVAGHSRRDSSPVIFSAKATTIISAEAAVQIICRIIKYIGLLN